MQTQSGRWKCYIEGCNDMVYQLTADYGNNHNVSWICLQDLQGSSSSSISEVSYYVFVAFVYGVIGIGIGFYIGSAKKKKRLARGNAEKVKAFVLKISIFLVPI